MTRPLPDSLHGAAAVTIDDRAAVTGPGLLRRLVGAAPAFGRTPPSAPSRPFDRPWLHRLTARNRFARKLSIGIMARLELAVLGGHKDPDVLDAIRAARSTRESLLSGNEAFTLFSLARAQSALGGDMAEVGVFEGASARLISIASDGARLDLFDTFVGLPCPEQSEHRFLREGFYAASLASVQDFLADRPDLHFHQGLFPDTAPDDDRVRYGFVHLDVDLRSSTLACLEYFYPRLLPGGIILSHDYSYLAGVRDAFAEFLADRPERAIELPTSQAMLVKR